MFLTGGGEIREIPNAALAVVREAVASDADLQEMYANSISELFPPVADILGEDFMPGLFDGVAKSIELPGHDIVSELLGMDSGKTFAPFGEDFMPRLFDGVAKSIELPGHDIVSELLGMGSKTFAPFGEDFMPRLFDGVAKSIEFPGHDIVSESFADIARAFGATEAQFQRQISEWVGAFAAEHDVHPSFDEIAIAIHRTAASRLGASTNPQDIVAYLNLVVVTLQLVLMIWSFVKPQAQVTINQIEQNSTTVIHPTTVIHLPAEPRECHQPSAPASPTP